MILIICLSSGTQYKYNVRSKASQASLGLMAQTTEGPAEPPCGEEETEQQGFKDDPLDIDYFPSSPCSSVEEDEIERYWFIYVS